MRTELLSLILGLAVTVTVAAAPAAVVETTAQVRAGFDSNPVATSGAGAAILGGRDAATLQAGWTVAWTRTGGDPATTAKLSYAFDAVRFDGWADEDFQTHRFGLGGRRTWEGWQLTGDGSALWVDGSRDTLASVPGCNANGTTLWRERRAQWQHRAKLGAQRAWGPTVVRLVGSLLDYDYRARAVAGDVPFADRRERLAGAEAGRRISPASLWFGGVRVGRQEQDRVPLPGGAFDYSSRIVRFVTGWEGKPSAGSTLSVAAGPDFRRFDGATDDRVFVGRDRTSLWVEGNGAVQLAPRWELTGKAGRWVWLSSSGKSAYTDTAAEAVLAWTPGDRTTWRVSGKVHRCAYFPAVRDDWEGLAGFGATRRLSARTQLTGEFLFHAGWNGASGVAEREFSRTTASFGVTTKL